jgi:hypothetical protein
MLIHHRQILFFYSDPSESDFSTVRVVENLYQQNDYLYIEEKFSRYDRKVDFVIDYFHENDFVEGSDQFVEEDVVVPRYLVFYKTDQEFFFASNDIEDVMPSSSCQGFS